MYNVVNKFIVGDLLISLINSLNLHFNLPLTWKKGDLINYFEEITLIGLYMHLYI